MVTDIKKEIVMSSSSASGLIDSNVHTYTAVQDPSKSFIDCTLLALQSEHQEWMQRVEPFAGKVRRFPTDRVQLETQLKRLGYKCEAACNVDSSCMAYTLDGGRCYHLRVENPDKRAVSVYEAVMRSSCPSAEVGDLVVTGNQFTIQTTTRVKDP